MAINKPECLKLTGNLAENFKRFKDEITIFFDATKTTSEPMKVQVARLLNLAGSEGIKIYKTFNTDLDKETVQSVLAKFEEWCTPKKNELMEHYKFFTRKQDSEEPFGKFYSDLRVLVKSCGFGLSENKFVKMQIIHGINNKELQAKLLREDLDLENVVRQCQISEQADINAKLIESEKGNRVDSMGHRQFKTGNIKRPTNGNMATTERSKK